MELFGFKSFKDRTVIQFDPGTTGIVGPNGCGKSNIVDALVWVMGEMSAKHLRGSNMSDVIFAGSEGFAPMGMAEVSLTLENDGGPFPAKYSKHSEVMVTRKLHRSGESEYLINKQPARLKDIQEIFMDTGAGAKGFSIIEQGAIGKIITAKPEDRRMLIEEAAGITKFKVRKRESQRKLKSTDQNLLRLLDIIGEQKRQLGSLERQAQRAERFRKLKNQVQDKELWVNSKQYLLLEGQVKAASEKLQLLKENEVGTTSDIDQMQIDLQSLKLEVTQKETLVDDIQLQHKQIQTLVIEIENEIRELKFEVEQARRDKEKTGSVMEQYKARQHALKLDLARVTELLNLAHQEAEEALVKYEEKSVAYEQIQKTIDDVDTELTHKRREMLVKSQGESHLEAQLMGVQAQLENAADQREQALAVHGELELKKADFEQHRNNLYKKLEGQKQMQLDVMRDVENFAENLQLLEGKLEVKSKEMETFKEQLNEVSGKLYGLENLHSNFEGFQQGVKSVMLWQRQKQEQAQVDGTVSVSFQPVAEVVEVPEKYEMAMEAALGSRLQLLLADDSQASVQAVDYLKESKAGRSSFMSEDHVGDLASSTPENLPQGDEVLAILKDVVKVPEKFRSQIFHFLKDVVVVDSIRSALKLRPIYPGKTFVTMDGDSLSEDGVLTGGTAESAESGVLKRRREIKELSQQREEWAGKLSLAQVTVEKLKAQKLTLESELEKAKKRQNEQEILVVELKKDYERAENELGNAQQALERHHRDLDHWQQKHTDLEQQQQVAQERLEELKTDRLILEERVEELTVQLKVHRDGVGSLQNEVMSLKVLSASTSQKQVGLTSQQQMLTQSLHEVETSLSTMTEESEKSSESLSSNSVLIEQRQVDLESRIHKAKEVETLLDAAQDDYEQTAQLTRELEDKVNASNRALNEYQSQLNSAQLALEQLKMKESYLLDQTRERYLLDISEYAQKYKDQDGEYEGQDIKAIEQEVEILKGKLAKIGEVNLSAIEEYDELKERYEFLSQQHQDLVEAKDQLRRVIDRINRICTRRFKDTFEQVNERFQKVFPVLFGGGEARLILVENPDKDEMGIDIIAKPPGKKPQSVSLLSGGEKALTAVSLIFSIFLVKPSPYCLLDEVDAPLDDANVVRFNDLVQEMAKRSQIIIVTHNKHTMKVNNKLYGVTQEHKGVSKMVSVDLGAAAKLAEI